MPLVPPSQPISCYAIDVASMVGDWAKNYARPASLIEAIYMCVLSPSEPLPGHYVGRHRAMKRPLVGGCGESPSGGRLCIFPAEIICVVCVDI